MGRMGLRMKIAKEGKERSLVKMRKFSLMPKPFSSTTLLKRRTHKLM
jgi:hypothetical protein